jgi:hypothetical protein
MGVYMHKVQVQVVKTVYFTGLEWFLITVNGVTAAERSSERDAWNKATELSNRLKGELSLELKIAA